MANDDDLLADLLAHPDDLTRRSVYADWLASEGDPRGTFIAQQLELDGMDGLEPRYPVLKASTDRLQARHEQSWVEPYLDATGLEPDHYSRTEISPTRNAVFERGFLVSIASTPENADAAFAAIRESEPLEGLQLVTHGIDPDTPASTGQWSRIQVRADDWITSFALSCLLRWDLANLSKLDISGMDLGTAGPRLLANEPTDLGDFFDEFEVPPPLREGQIRELAMHGCQIGDEGLKTLVTAPGLDLTHLDVGQNQITDAETLDALRTDRLDGLKSLGLSGNNPLGPELGALAGWPVLTTLRHLTLPQTTTPEAFKALFPTPSPALRELDVASAKTLLTDPTAVASASEAWVRLNLGTARVGDKGLPALLEVESTHTLVDFKLNGCSLSDKAIEALLAAPLTRLVRLDISSNKLSDASIHGLLEWPGLPQLAHLRIGNNRKISAEGYQALMDAPAFDPAVFDVGKVKDDALADALHERFGAALKIRR